MRPIILATALGKSRPVLVLTRTAIRPHLRGVTIAPITSRSRGLPTEVAVGPSNGIERPSVVNCDNILTIPSADAGKQIGRLLPEQEPALAAAIAAAFDLSD